MFRLRLLFRVASVMILVMGWSSPTIAALVTANLMVQLDGDSTSNFVLNGSAVNVWNDKATDGMTEGTFQNFGNNAAANQPTLLENYLMPNGTVHNVVDFTRGAISSSSSNSSTTSSDFLVSQLGGASGAFSPGGDAAYSPGGTAGADGLSWFTVFKSDIITHPVGSSNRHRQARQTLLVSNTSDMAIVNTMTAALTEGGTTDPDVSLYSAGRDSLGIQSAYETGDAEGALTAQWYIVGTSWDLDSGAIVSRFYRQDGTDTGYVTHSVNAAWTTPLPVNTETIIGQRFSTAVNGTNYAFDGQMAEVLIYNAALSQANMTSVVDYLKQKYLVAPPPANLTWKGGLSGNAWDISTTANWNNNTATFKNLDIVTFDDGGSNSPAVELTGSIGPGSITVNNSAGHDYTFAGTGALIGVTGITKEGAGKLILANTGTNTLSGPIALNGGTLILDRANVETLAGDFSGSGTLEKKGVGNVTLGGASPNFSGPVILTEGALTLRSTLGTGATVATAAGTTTQLSGSGTWALARRITGDGSVEKIAGSEIVQLTAENDYTGTLTNNGLLSLGNGGVTGALGGQGAVTNNGTLYLNLAKTYTLDRQIIGAGGLNFDARGGVVSLAGDNSYDGSTVIDQGTVVLKHSNGLGSSLSGTSVLSDGANQNGQLVLDGSAGDLSINDNFTLNGGAGTNFQYYGNGVIHNLAGNNTIYGGISIPGGGSGTKITTEGGTLNLAGTIVVTGTKGRALILGGSGNGIVSGILANGASSQPLYVIKAGSGTWNLKNFNLYTSWTSIFEGTLALSDFGSISSCTNIVLHTPAATLDVSALADPTLILNQNLAGVGKVIGNVKSYYGFTISPGGGGVISENIPSSGSMTMTIQGNLTLVGSETLQFNLTDSTTSPNNDRISVSGALNMEGSAFSNTKVLIIPRAALATGAYTLLTAASQNNIGGGIFELDPNHNTRYTMSLNNPPGQLQLNVSGSNANLTWSGGTDANWDLKTTANWTGGGDGLFWQGDAVTFDDSSTNTNDVVINGILTPASVTVNATRDYVFSGTGDIQGGASITKMGSGTLTINNDNHFTGAVNINGGILKVGNGNYYNLGHKADGPNLVDGGTIINGGTLDMNSQLLYWEKFSAQGVGKDSMGAIVNSGSTTVDLYYLTLTGDASFGGTRAWRIVGPPPGQGMWADGYLHGNNKTFTKVGDNEIDLINLGETNLGDVRVEGGSLYFYGSTTLGNTAGGKKAYLANNGNLGLWNGTATYAKPIVVESTHGQFTTWGGPHTVASTVTLDGTLTVSPGDADLTMNGPFSGAGGLTKELTGKLILGGTNDYTGNTQINAGILELASTGQIAASAITNNAVFQINGGTHTLGAIGGTGTMNVLAGSAVTATSIAQTTLTIGGLGSAMAAVPEPATWLLLLTGLLGWVGLRRIRAAR